MPSTIAPHRDAKSGGKNAAMNCVPRGSPSTTRPQSTSSVPRAAARYAAAPIPIAQRSRGLLMNGGFVQALRAATAAVMVNPGRSGHPGDAIPVNLRHGVVLDRFIALDADIIHLANRRLPVLLAVDLGQHIG